MKQLIWTAQLCREREKEIVMDDNGAQMAQT